MVIQVPSEVMLVAPYTFLYTSGTVVLPVVVVVLAVLPQPQPNNNAQKAGVNNTRNFCMVMVLYASLDAITCKNLRVESAYFLVV